MIGLFKLGGDIADEATHLDPDGMDVAVNLARFSLGHNFDTTVREVTHVPDNLKTARQPAAGRSKPDALNPARTDDAPSFQSHEFPRCSVRSSGMRPA
jgi:hypothetical protein